MSNKIDYFEYFKEISILACKQAQYLSETLENYDHDSLPERMKYMHSIEHEADIKKSEMITELIKEFLPPIDRDDIVSLSELYDNVCDTIDEVLLEFYMHDIKECTPEAKVISKKIVEICLQLHELSENLKGFKKPDTLIEKVIQVNDIEDEGDKLYTSVMHELFSKCDDSKTLLCWSNIYACLEECFDACEHAADLIRNVIIKNS